MIRQMCRTPASASSAMRGLRLRRQPRPDAWARRPAAPASRPSSRCSRRAAAATATGSAGPTSRPDRPRMNENSPTCARSIPAVAATRMVVAAARNAPVATVALTITSSTAIPMMTGNCPSSTDGIDEHPERDEEQAREDVAQRTNLGVRLMAVLALREDQTAEKRAERHRDAEERAGPRRADAREQHRQRKRFAAPAAGDQPEEHRQDEPADDGHDADRRRGLRQHFGARRTSGVRPDRIGTSSSRPTMQRS